MASAAPHWDKRAESIAAHLQQIEVNKLDIWPDLDALSTHTRVEAIEAPIEGVTLLSDGRFTAILNLYLLLQYGKNNEEGFSTSDSFRAKVEGHMDGHSPIVDRSTVDTSSFYKQ